MAILGGIFALWLTGTAFSVSSAIGFVALFGIAAMDGILVLSYYHLSLELGHDRATRHAADLPHAAAAGHDDLHGRLRRTGARGVFDRNRLAGAAAARAGGGRRHAARAGLLILLVLPVLILKFSQAQELPSERRGAARAGRRPSPDGGRMTRIRAGFRICRVGPARVSAAAALLSACVGPNFHRPAAPPSTATPSSRLPPPTASAPGVGGAAQRFLAQQDVRGNWWTLFGSAELDALVSEALRANPEVARGAGGPAPGDGEHGGAARNLLSDGAGSFDASRNRDATGVVQPTLQSGTAVYSLYHSPGYDFVTCPMYSARIAVRWSRWQRRPRRAVSSSMPPI